MSDGLFTVIGILLGVAVGLAILGFVVKCVIPAFRDWMLTEPKLGGLLCKHEEKLTTRLTGGQVTKCLECDKLLSWKIDLGKPVPVDTEKEFPEGTTFWVYWEPIKGRGGDAADIMQLVDEDDAVSWTYEYKNAGDIVWAELP